MFISNNDAPNFSLSFPYLLWVLVIISLLEEYVIPFYSYPPPFVLPFSLVKTQPDIGF